MPHPFGKGVAIVAADKHVGVNEDVVRVDSFDRFCHRSKDEVRELFFLLFSEQIEMPRHPDTQLEIDDLLILESCLLQEQLKHIFALFFHLFLFFAHSLFMYKT